MTRNDPRGGTTPQTASGTRVLAAILLMSTAIGPAASAAGDREFALEIELPAQALETSLLDVAELYGETVIAPSELVSARLAPTVRGTFTLEEAIERLLRDTELVARRTDSGAVIVEERPAPAPAPSPARPEARAARSPGPGPPQVEEIVIYGAKEPRLYGEVTTSVEVFNEERLERRSIFDLDEVLRQTPNVLNSGPTINLSIRGLARRRPEEGTASNIYFDGAPASGTALEAGIESLWDVSQVEILRGPQSAPQGRNALAGAVYISTNDPVHDWESRAFARFASFDTRQYSSVLNIPVIEGEVAVRLASDYRVTDGLVDSATDGRDFDARRSRLFRGKVLAEPHFLPGLRAELLVEKNRSEIGSTHAFVNFNRSVTDPSFANFDTKGRLTFNTPIDNDTDILRIIGDLRYDATDWLSIAVISTYEDVDRRQVVGDLATASGSRNFDANETTKTLTEELRFEVDYGPFSGALGGYFFRLEDNTKIESISLIRDSTGSTITVDPLDAIAAGSQIGQRDIQNWAVFARGRMELFDRLTFEASVRYDSERQELNSLPLTGLRASPPSCTLTFQSGLIRTCQAVIESLFNQDRDPFRSNDFNAFIPRASVTVRVLDEVSVFLAATRGYSAGGTFLQALVQGLVNEVVVREFDPEFLYQFELGFRSEWLDNRLRVNGNVFGGIYIDQQISVPGPSGTFTDSEIVNVGRSTTAGVEITADAVISNSLTAFLSFGYLETEIQHLPYALSGPYQSLAGNQLARAPRFSLALGASYEHPSGWLEGVFVNGSLTYRSSYFGDIENLDAGDIGFGFSERVDDRVIVSMRLGYDHEFFTIFGYVTNLFDEDDAGRNVASINRTFGNVSLFGNPSFGVVPPRTLGIAIEVRPAELIASAF